MSAMLTDAAAASGAAAGARNTIGSSSSGRTSSEPGLVLADLDERDVDVAGLDGADQLLAVPGLTQHDLDAGPLRPEGADEAGEDLGADARQRSHPQLALFARGQRPQVGGGGTDAGEDGPGVASAASLRPP